MSVKEFLVEVFTSEVELEDILRGLMYITPPLALVSFLIGFFM